MKIMRKIEPETNNIVFYYEKKLYTYGTDGIYICFGKFKGTNLTKSYIEEGDGIIEYLYDITESSDINELTEITYRVIRDIKNNYPKYEKSSTI